MFFSRVKNLLVFDVYLYLEDLDIFLSFVVTYVKKSGAFAYTVGGYMWPLTTFTFTLKFTFMHLADVYTYIGLTYTFKGISPGFKPTTMRCYRWATGNHQWYIRSEQWLCQFWDQLILLIFGCTSHGVWFMHIKSKKYVKIIHM